VCRNCGWKAALARPCSGERDGRTLHDCGHGGGCCGDRRQAGQSIRRPGGIRGSGQMTAGKRCGLEWGCGVRQAGCRFGGRRRSAILAGQGSFVDAQVRRDGRGGGVGGGCGITCGNLRVGSNQAVGEIGRCNGIGTGGQRWEWRIAGRTCAGSGGDWRECGEWVHGAASQREITRAH